MCSHIHANILSQFHLWYYDSEKKKATWGVKLFSDYSFRLQSIIVAESRQKIKQLVTPYQQSIVLIKKYTLDYLHICLLSAGFLLSYYV